MEVNLCNVLIYLDNTLRFVINLPSENEKENFVQAVRVEKCLNEGESCNLVTCDGSTTVCRRDKTKMKFS